MASGTPEPGVTTVRMPEPGARSHELPVREADVEICFVCKKCRVAFPGESPLLTHQRQCFGGNLEARGAFRVVQTGYECKLCGVPERFKSPQEFRRHWDLLHKVSSGLPPPSESPLSHEMEDVVNQITLLAAKAAQEAGPDVNSNAAFCAPADSKRRFLPPPADLPQPLTSAGH